MPEILKEFIRGTILVAFGFGLIYWLYLAYIFKSVAMFVLGIVPPLTFISAIVGLWSAIFQIPQWVLDHFNNGAPYIPG